MPSAEKPPTYHGEMLGGGSITLFHVRGIRISVDWSWFLVLFLLIFWMSQFYGDCSASRASATTPFRACGAERGRLLRLDPPARARPRGRREAQRDRHHQHPALDLRRRGADGSRGRQPRHRVRGGARRPGGDAGDRRRRSPPVGIAAVGWDEFRNAAVLESRPRASPGSWRWSPGWPRSTSWSWSSTCCRPSRWTAAASPARSPGGGPATAPRRPASPPTSAASSATCSSAGGLALIFTGDLFGGVWLALIGMVINGSARGAAMQTAITSRIDEHPRRRRDGPRAGRDPRRAQRRAGPRRVLPPLPLALVPGRRRRPPLPRPARSRPRRRGAGGLPRQRPGLRPRSSGTTASSRSATTPRSTRCSATRTCAASAP